MSHKIIIGDEGIGPGGTVKAGVEWTPDHGLSFEEQGKRVKKVEKLLEKVDDLLYAAPGYEHDDP